MTNGAVDRKSFASMVDLYMSYGFNYFDTAHGYLEGESEKAIRDCLVSRYPRERFILTNKLTNSFFRKEGGVKPLFESQLKVCGTDYFDWYLMHSMNSVIYEKYKRCRCFETASSLLAEGKIKHIGISFHDKASVLERILSEQLSIEAVQIQFNFLDYEDSAIQSRLCYEVCRKFGKKVFVMEPIKGGRLADIDGFDNSAALALKFAAGFEGVEYVLSGMSTVEQVKENCLLFSSMTALSDYEKSTIEAIVKSERSKNLIQCTSCGYCTAGCPKKIAIPNILACLNAKKMYGGNHYDYYYNFVHTSDGAKASSCIDCGQCEAVCPQHIPVRDYLKTAVSVFESKSED